ncbi:MAG: SDR family oxidoreductase [Porticoccaceae bacterium]|jgi:NAD(P)-dependent dehydrogenase (short-subunit alcohol dehydrogenase family)|nr:SDR family oxidoreductase [Porticoccaceae bacterium]MEA3300950.1 SDR family oxidoreductase [Pseudomonadota bacterium]HLS98361.1 SDR family oxidoreductase [Porticoccaceae bacterium]
MTQNTLRDVEGKVVIISGAQRGVGLATAKRLASGGARVVIADLPGLDMTDAAAQVAQYGEVAHGSVDIADESSVKALMEFTLDTFGRIDALDNNAARQGLMNDVDVLTMDVDVWDSVFAVNARGTMLMCKHAIAAMLKTGGGAIVNISSGTALAGHLYQTAYACSKGAINTLTKYIATQYGDRGIRCNTISLGLIKTERLAETMPLPMQEMFISHKLVPRLGKPEDIAEMVAFLVSDRSQWITGQTYCVDGGIQAKGSQVTDERRMMRDMGFGIGS